MKPSIPLLCAGLMLGAGQAWALPIVIDGSLADWGVKRTGQASDWTPHAGIQYSIEDQTGGSGSYLNPGWGGQAYDAEAIYATIQGGKLFIALATGHHPLTLHKPSANSYGAGDFAIDFGKDGVYELGINIKHVVNDSGAREAFGVEGGVYRNPTWALGLFAETDPNYPITAPVKRPAYMTAGEYIGLAELAYTTVGANGYGQYTRDMHYFYELALDLGLLRSAGWSGHDPFNIHWTMNCGNDSIWVDPPAPVPEPATLALLSLGLAGLLALRRRRQTGADAFDGQG